MKLIDIIRPNAVVTKAASQYAAQTNISEKRTGLVSAKSDQSHLARVVYNDFWGQGEAVISRASAMKVPPFAKAMGTYKSVIGPMPLRAYDENGLVASQPTWLYRTDGDSNPFERNCDTVEDLMLYGESLWYTVRGSEGQILDATRVVYENWDVDEWGQIVIGKKVMTVDEVIYFRGQTNGFLIDGKEAIIDSADMQRTMRGRLRNPNPMLIIQQQEATELTQDEIDDFTEYVSDSLRSPNGAVIFADSRIKLEPQPSDDAPMFVEARNALRTDVANLTNMPTSMLDGSVSTASLTYSTSEGKRNEFDIYSLPMIMGVIEWRISQDDCVPRGTRVRYDRTDYNATASNASPTGPVVED